jgi:V/A-type H+-transporting ATPase subunit E
MGLEKVIEQIEKDGEEKTRSLLQDSEKQAAQVLQTMQRDLEEKGVQKKQETEKQIAALQTQEKSAVEIEAKKIRLNAEKDILASTYQQCLTSLESLPHETILAALVRTVQKEMPEAAVIYSNKRDEAVVRSLSTLRYSGVIECLGGVVAENSDKTLTVDLRYETIAATVWERSLKEIAKELFG